jgi:hypothetical protein
MRNKLVLLIAAYSLLGATTAVGQVPNCTEPGSIRSVTKARQGNLETVTFEYIGRKLPDVVEVQDKKPPITNYGGETLHIKGNAFKSVHMHLVGWTCKIRENFKTRTSTIQDIRQTEQFEGYVSYAIGYSAKSKYVGKSVVRAGRITKLVLKFRR